MYANQILVWKELNYGIMSEKEKQLVVTEVSDTLSLSFLNDLLSRYQPITGELFA